jgi:hypothetical protein
MKARETDEYPRSLGGGWGYAECAVDAFKSGNPTTDVRALPKA